MKRFLINIGLFSLLFLMYFGINYLINTQIIKKTLPKLEGHTLILGASDVQAALDNTLFTSAVNIAQLGEPNYFSYWKLKSLLANNSIDTVFMGVTYANFSTSYEQILSNRMPNWSRNLFRRMHAVSAFNELSGIDIDRSTLLEINFKEMCLMPKRQHHHYIGAYANHPVGVGNPNNVEANIDLHFSFEEEKSQPTRFPIKYLKKINQLCLKNEVKLILISTPMHPRYLEAVPQRFVVHFKKMKAELMKEGILFLDYSAAKYADEEFYDSCHLNRQGATRFTKALQTDLANQISSKQKELRD